MRGGLQEAGLVGMVPKVPGVGLPRMQPSWIVLEIRNILQSVYFHRSAGINMTSVFSQGHFLMAAPPPPLLSISY